MTEITFTAIERNILRVLHANMNEKVATADIVAAGWPNEADPDNLWVKPHLSRIRRKVAIVRPHWTIKAHYGGKGYTLYTRGQGQR